VTLDPDATPPPRRYGGKTADERREARRERLVEAGIELFGTVGYRATSIRSVMRESGLGERYFYESFASLDELLVAAAQAAQGGIKQTVLDAIDLTNGLNFEDSLREAMTALARSFERDPRVLRIAMLETIGVSATVTKARNMLLDDFISLLAGVAMSFGDIDEADAELLAIGLLGAANEMLMRWATGQIDADLATVIAELEIIFSGTYERAAAKAAARSRADAEPGSDWASKSLSDGP
jgi:AcrR family transcriptional regulator